MSYHKNKALLAVNHGGTKLSMKTSKSKTAAKKKKVMKEFAPEVRKVQNFKAKPSEISIIKANAKKFAGGNVAGWVRNAAMKYRPSAADLV